MSYNIQYSETFMRSAKKLAKRYPSFKKDLTDFISILSDNPTSGTVLGNNLFKVQMSVTSKSRGKSGGVRVITCVIYKAEQILLAEIYDKSDYSTVDEKQVMKNLKGEGFDL